MNKWSEVSRVNRYRQRGLSLIELMVAMVIGLILIAGVIEIYVNSKQTYRNQDALSRLQENGRYALGTLATNIRPAGFSGCGTIESVKPVIIALGEVPPSYDSSTAVIGYENTGGLTWDVALPAGLNADVGDSDVITVARAGDCGAHLTGNLIPNNANIQVTTNTNNSCGFAQNQVLMISDCTSAHVFRVTNNPNSGGPSQTLTHGNATNNNNKLDKIYQTDAEVLTFDSETYFVRNGAGGIPALWVLDNTQPTGGGNPLELVEGVESLQVLYGVDDGSDSVADSYVDASVAKTKWDKVVAVRIELLMRTIENLQAADYSFHGVTYTGGFLRQELHSTIKLRNRGLL